MISLVSWVEEKIYCDSFINKSDVSGRKEGIDEIIVVGIVSHSLVSKL